MSALDSAMSDFPRYPIREHSAHTPKPSSEFERRCRHCGASFIGLAPGRTGERGLWVADWTWVCSIECRDALGAASSVKSGDSE